jgi:hypothetical protein
VRLVRHTIQPEHPRAIRTGHLHRRVFPNPSPLRSPAISLFRITKFPLNCRWIFVESKKILASALEFTSASLSVTPVDQRMMSSRSAGGVGGMTTGAAGKSIAGAAVSLGRRRQPIQNTGEQVSTAIRSNALRLLWIPNDGEQGKTMYWRKGWDSNPRCPCRHAGFQDRCLKPLGHPS